ncbi:MAG: DUF3471 domain-containing protein [Porphyrobacter sp.]|nr:DUF3471 domain-containing protein [Porphyrobacter sp.]
MTDTALTDLGPFFARYDRRTRVVLATALCISLMLSAAIATRLLTAGAPGPRGAGVVWTMGVLFAPALGVGWWGMTEFLVRSRRKQAAPDGSHPASTEDARNATRIATAGFAFNIALIASGIAVQVLMGLQAFGHPVGYPIGFMIPRMTTIAVGLATIYLGNLWPKMPTPRTPERKAAKMMKAYRFGGWLQVICGALIVLFGLFLPYLIPHARPTQPPFEAWKHKEISLPATQLDKFVGRYDFGNGFTVSVTHPGPTLWVRREGIAGERGGPVYPEAPNAFFWKAVEAQIRFTADARGNVTGAEFREAGPWQPGKRLTP